MHICFVRLIFLFFVDTQHRIRELLVVVKR